MSKQIQLKNGEEKVYPNPFFPVGSIYMSVNSTNPSSYFGGVWVAWGQGRVAVGVNTSGTFNSVEKMGGSESHSLSENEMPAHQHASTFYGGYYAFGGNSGNPAQGGGYGTQLSDLKTGWSGGSQAHNNLQPYITCYMFKRTA